MGQFSLTYGFLYSVSDACLKENRNLIFEIPEKTISVFHVPTRQGRSILQKLHFLEEEGC